MLREWSRLSGVAVYYHVGAVKEIGFTGAFKPILVIHRPGSLAEELPRGWYRIAKIVPGSRAVVGEEDVEPLGRAEELRIAKRITARLYTLPSETRRHRAWVLAVGEPRSVALAVAPLWRRAYGVSFLWVDAGSGGLEADTPTYTEVLEKLVSSGSGRAAASISREGVGVVVAHRPRRDAGRGARWSSPRG